MKNYREFILVFNYKQPPKIKWLSGLSELTMKNATDLPLQMFSDALTLKTIVVVIVLLQAGFDHWRSHSETQT